MNPSELLPEDYDHPIFSSSSLDGFVNHWKQLDQEYDPSAKSQSFRILATFQRMGLAVVQCSDGRNGSVWDVKFADGKALVYVDIPEDFGLHKAFPSELTLMEIKRP